MDSVQYHTGAHCVYLTQYHIIWCPKFRYPILHSGRDKKLKHILEEVCFKHHYIIKAMEVMPDHIHIFIDAPQTAAPCEIARTLKSMSAKLLLKQDPERRAFYSRCKVLWSKGYYIQRND